MRVGRYRKGGRSRPCLLLGEAFLLDWAELDRDLLPDDVRDAVHRACLSSATTADLLQAVPLLESWMKPHEKEWGHLPHLALPDKMEPPVQPRSFICVGLNYRDHAAEQKAELPSQPLLFCKAANALAGHGAIVPVPAGSQKLDYEAELAVVIGKTCSKVQAAEALDYVAGYTCCNDLSARDFQFADGQWFRGKSCDGFGPLGPWLVTPADIGDPHQLRIRSRLNGETMQDASTAELIFSVPKLIEFISAHMTLQPGDVISTGTPAGVGFSRKPPVYLKAGDLVEIEIERLGILKTRIG